MNREDKFLNDFSVLLAQLIRKFNLLERDEKVCYNVTLSQCYTLETLARKGKLAMKELSQEIGVAISTMTRILDVLVRDGLVKRKDAPSDRRMVYIELTNQGQDLALKLKRCIDDHVGTILAKIPKSKQQQVIESLQVLVAAIDQQTSCCSLDDKSKR